MISILLPIFNGIEFIDESVNSVLDQSFKNWELLIGINGHSENSDVYKIAKKFEEKHSRIKVFDFYTLNNKVDTLHSLLKLSNYNWIALIDIDDIWLPNKLKKQINYTDCYDIIGTNAHYIGDLDYVPLLPYYDISKFNFTDYNPIINSSVLLKKDLCKWYKEFEGFEDYELWMRLFKNENKFYNIPDILVRHRIHVNSNFNIKNFNERINQLKQKYLS